jgi:hypothetical protein
MESSKINNIGKSADWGYQLRPNRPVFDLLCASPEQQLRVSRWLKADRIWFALTRRSMLDRAVRQVMEREGQVVTVYKIGSLVAACKGSYRTGKLKAIQNKEDQCIWASRAALGVKTEVRTTGPNGSGQRTVTGWMEGPQGPLRSWSQRICDFMTETHVGLGGIAGGAAGTARVAARLRQQADLTRGLKQQIDPSGGSAGPVLPARAAVSAWRPTAR